MTFELLGSKSSLNIRGKERRVRTLTAPQHQKRAVQGLVEAAMQDISIAKSGSRPRNSTTFIVGTGDRREARKFSELSRKVASVLRARDYVVVSYSTKSPRSKGTPSKHQVILNINW